MRQSLQSGQALLGLSGQEKSPVFRESVRTEEG